MIDELKRSTILHFPIGFGLSDSAMADTVNVCLKLNPDDLIDATYVKNLRHREKRFLAKPLISQ